AADRLGRRNARRHGDGHRLKSDTDVPAGARRLHLPGLHGAIHAHIEPRRGRNADAGVQRVEEGGAVRRHKARGLLRLNLRAQQSALIKVVASKGRLPGSGTGDDRVTIGAEVSSLANALNAGFEESKFTVSRESAPLGSSVPTTVRD